MAITASGFYAPTLEKMFIDTAAQSMESETAVKGLLVTDAYTHDYDLHDFRDDVSAAEVTGTGYTAGGVTITTTDWTIGAPAVGQMKYDHDDPQWASSTITNAMALVTYFNVGLATTDMLLYLLDFVTAVSTQNGLLLVSINVNGAVNIDHTP